MFPYDFSDAGLAFQLFQQDLARSTSGSVADVGIRLLFVASVAPDLVMMPDAERRAFPTAPAANDIDAEAFAALDPPALAVGCLAQQNLAGRGDETHVCSHGM
jgi:hypothetical protein